MHESEFNTLFKAAGITTGKDTIGAANVGFADGGSAKMDGLPYAFGRFGLVNGTTFYELAWGGRYWSGTVKSSSEAYHLFYYGSALHPAHYGARFHGWNVRCVAR